MAARNAYTDYQQVLQWGGIDALPARLLYEHVLPETVARLTDPAVPYHRGSPYGGKGWDTSDPTIGDVVSAFLRSRGSSLNIDYSTNGKSGPEMSHTGRITTVEAVVL